MTHAKTQRRKEEGSGEALSPFASLRLCVRFFLCLLAVVTMPGCILPVSVPISPKVSGHVYDAHTKKPVAGAVVTTGKSENARQFVTKTDAEGAFVLPAHKKFEVIVFLAPMDPPMSTTLLILREGYHNYSSCIPLWRPSEGIKVLLQPKD